MRGCETLPQCLTRADTLGTCARAAHGETQMSPAVDVNDDVDNDTPAEREGSVARDIRCGARLHVKPRPRCAHASLESQQLSGRGEADRKRDVAFKTRARTARTKRTNGTLPAEPR